MTVLQRYKEKLHTPGDNSPGARFIQSDQAARDDWDTNKERRAELVDNLGEVNHELSEIETNLGAWVADKLVDYKEYTVRLGELRLEIEALQSGVKYLDDQAELIRRYNPGID